MDKKGGISNLFSYLAQGRLQAGEKASSNVMLTDLSNRELLELGSFKEIYEQTDYVDEAFGDVSEKVKKSDPVAVFLTALTYLAIAYLTFITGGLALTLVGAAIGATEALGVGITSQIYGTSKKFHATDNIVAGDQNTLLEAYWSNRNQIKTKDETAQIKSTLEAYTQALINYMDSECSPFPCSIEGIAENKPGSYGVGCDEPATNGFQLVSWAPPSMGWGGTGHYTYLAGAMGEAAGTSSSDYTSGSKQWMIEAFDVLAHPKYYQQKKGVFKENYTDPDDDYNALILMYKLEALAETYGDHVGNIVINYLTKRITTSQTIEALDALTDSSLGDQTLTLEDVKMIKTYIDGENLFTEDEDISEYEKKTLTQCWTENKSIMGVLNKLYGSGSKGLNADEVSLWSENMRMYIDRTTTDGQTLTTKMQRTMQRCNETTSLATQMLKSIGDVWKQVYSNIR
ncbi:MAG: hypothetical protein LBC30_01280 [Puniceicoccales bacterium]|nr:hypothetical protein [Puniceicoccales bacterium]